VNKRIPLAGAAGAAALAVAIVLRLLKEEDNRSRIARGARVWKLSARRGAHYAVTRVRGKVADEEKRKALEARFAIRTAEDVAKELGDMKGLIMKVGQLVGFIAEGLPPEAHQALAMLQSDAPPMAPSLAESVVEAELGTHPEKLFLDWGLEPVGAASIGQVHKAVLRDGRIVAIKVQYPGIERAIRHDLDSAELLYAMFSQLALRGLDVKGLVEELRARVTEELDYRVEAANQRAFADIYRGHPFIRIPDVVSELSTERVLTTEWVDGMTWVEFEASADRVTKQRAAEVLFRFAQGSIHRYGMFNGDPHPGNYRFHRDGSMTFIDFGLTKRWTEGEWERLSPCLEAIVIERDPERLVTAMEVSGFLAPGHGLDPRRVYDYVASPYVPYMTDTYTFTRRFVPDTLGKIVDLEGPYADVIRALNMPPSFLILDRVVWGVSALLGKLNASGPWRGILLEYRQGAPPQTALGREDAAWRAARRH
jgi:predicted unusual protein kinase regulating ubiquinone biosynthesis (AarF/ABC1/UbiB family)